MSQTKYYLPLIHNSKVSIYPYFRLGGFGLGNILFPYSRALCASLKNGANLLYPHCNQIQPRNFLRERNFNSLRNYSYDFKKLEWISLSQSKSAFIFYFNKFEDESFLNNSKYIYFEGLKNYFYDFFEYRDTLRKFFYLSFNNKLKIQSKLVALHIRLGDFLINNQSISPEKIRYAINFFTKKSYEIKIFSDSNSTRLKEYIDYSKLPENVSIVRSISPLVDIMKMSQSEIICGSPYSTFVEWARFLRNEDLDMNSYSLINQELYEKIAISPSKWNHFL